MAKGKVGHRRRPQDEEGHGDAELVPLRIRDGAFKGAYVRQWHSFPVFRWIGS